MTITQDERRSRGRPQVRPDDETRHMIYEAARHEFAERGFAATTVDTVARRAGVSTKTVYRLIPTKALLFEGTIADRMDRFVASVELRGCNQKDPELALTAALIACGELVFADEVVSLYRMMLTESDRFPELGETFYKTAMQRTVHALADWLRARVERGLIVLDDVETAAGMLLGMLVFEPQRAALYGHQPLPDRAAIAARAQNCARLFLQGCVKKAP